MAFLYGQLLVVEELDRQEQRNRARLYRRRVRDAQDPFTIADSIFRRNFRLNKEAAIDLINAMMPYMNDGVRGTKIPKMLRVLATCHFLATGSYQRSAGSNYLVCLSQPMLCRSIKEVCNIILRYFVRQWIQFPRNEEEKNILKDRFHLHHGMPHIIGVVDGTHIAINRPNENENIYVNRKGYHSLNCQIICDSELKIINIVSRWPGSSHDAYVWRQSRIGQTMRANFQNGDNESKIMGDSGYALLPWLLVPLARPLTPQEHRFNDTFKRCRSLVERCIGLLKGRFRCLLKERTLHYAPRNAGRIILTCAVLHNIAIHYRVENPEPMWDPIDLEELPLPDLPNNNVVLRNMGQVTRQQYINQFF